MSIRQKMNNRFRDLEGGLFSGVTKADVGEGVGRLIEQGYDLLAWADPFYPDPVMPASVKQALIDSLEDRSLHYTMPIGSPELRRQVALVAKDRKGLDLDPNRNVLITPGSDSGLLYAMLPFLGEGDEVLVPDPSYPSNFLNPKLCGARCVSVPLREQDNYQLDVAEFEKRLTSNTKMVLISHPNNPTGTVFRRETLEDLCKFIVRHNLVLVCDQAFEDHIFDGVEFVSPAALPGMWERTLTVCSLSKGYGLSGLRVGYVLTEDRIMDVLYGGAVNVLGATNTQAQAAALAALKDDTILPAYHRVFERRRHACHRLWNTCGVKMRLPESGFLSWLDVSALGTDKEVASYLLENAKVIVNEGSFYGPLGGPGHLRIVHGCFADDAKAHEVYERIAAALESLGEKKGVC